MAAQLTVALATRKGGVGKTTLALALASRLSEKRRTLLIDLDQDGDCTFGLGGNLELPGSAALLTGGSPVFQQITPTLDLLCGNQDLEDPAIARLEPEALADAISKLDYECVVLDSPANAHHLQKLSVVAAKSVLIPLNAHPFAIKRGMALISDLAKRRESKRQGATKWAIVANLIDVRRLFDRQLVERLRSDTGVPVLTIHHRTFFSRATTAQKPCSNFPGGKAPMAEIDKLVKWVS